MSGQNDDHDDQAPPGETSGRAKEKTPTELRREREAAALRANLARRKQQRRGGRGGGSPGGLPEA